jgi:hypothetical protein
MTAGLATLLWMERGQTPTEVMFRDSLIASHLSRHADVQSAVQEAMQRLSGGSSQGRQPWILSRGVILDPEEIQIIHNAAADPTEACLRY